jgi:hypothetical protein
MKRFVFKGPFYKINVAFKRFEKVHRRSSGFTNHYCLTKLKDWSWKLNKKDN